MIHNRTTRSLLESFMMFLGIAFGVHGAALYAEVITIPTDQPTIQAGINVAAHGDTVSLEPGTYLENFVIGDKLLTLMSTAGRDSTFIEPAVADSSILTVLSSAHTLYLRGLTFRNGDAPYGGAIRSFDRPLNLRECSIIECVAESGGGIFLETGDFHAAQCLFADDSAYKTSAIAIVDSSEAIVDTSVFLRNKNTQGVGGEGGTIVIDAGSISLEGCVFEDNEGCHNTVLSRFSASINLKNCTIRRGKSNDCAWFDYGSLAGNIAGNQGRIEISSCFIESIDDWAVVGALYSTLYSGVDIIGSTIVDNTCVMYFELLNPPALRIDNTVIADNDLVYFPPSRMGRGDDFLPSVSCTDIYGNTEGDWTGFLAEVADSNGNFSADPRFCDPENGDYHIDAYSPCAPEYSPNDQLVGALGVGCQSDYICGDPNISGGIDIDDIVYLIDYVFLGGMSPIPVESGDCDCSGTVDIDDIVYLISYVFNSGAAPCDPDGDGEEEC